MIDSFQAIVMNEGDVELTLSTTNLKQPRPAKSLIQRLRSPKSSIRKSNNQTVSDSDHPPVVLNPSMDSNSILGEDAATDTSSIHKENPSPRDEWGISWSSSYVEKTQSSTTQQVPDEKRHHFQRKDFRKSTWMEAISKGSYSTYGIAAVMTATSIIVHPIIILAGVVWAVGAFRALDNE
jgi:hypothetical protein